MDFNIDQDLHIFDSLFQSRPEIAKDEFIKDLARYYLPFVKRLIDLKNRQPSPGGLIIGVSAIQGAGKSTQGEIMETLIDHFGFSSIHLSIDDHYLTHQQLNELRQKDPRYIRRGVTHDIPLAIKNLTDLKTMTDGQIVKIPVYDKGKWDGDGDRVGFKDITKKPDFIFYDGWMLGARRVEDESVFDSNLPALDSPEHIQFAKDINKKLDDYLPLWELIDFMNVLYVPNYQISIQWRDQAEDVLRAKNEGMSHDHIVEFVHYFWRSVHPAIHVKNLAHDSTHARQVVIIGDDHSIAGILTPGQATEKYP